MDARSQVSNDAYPWQATLPSILRDLKDEFEIANTTNVLNHKIVPKTLTTEAIFMIFLILLFVILTVIRSFISVCENFKVTGKETHSSTIEDEAKAKKGNLHTHEERKTLDKSRSAVFLKNLKKLLDCFNIKSNARKLLNTESTQKHLSSLHGIRSIMVIWVLFGHTSMFYGGAMKIPEKLQPLMDLKATQIFKNTIFIVDTFLVLSGFLNGYLFSQHYTEKKGKISWFSFYVYRFIRIAPMYFMALGFYSTLFPYLGSGIVWPTYKTNPVCKDNWIWHVLFLNNFIPHTKQCSTTTWYLACEMQIYIISPIFLILLMRKPKIGYFLTFLSICATCFINFIFTKEYKLTDGPTRLAEYYTTDVKEFQRRNWEYYDILYSRPYSRLGTFLIGVALGYYLFQKKRTTIKNNKVQLFLGWIMTASFMWTAMFALYGREESILENAIYNGLKHLLFSLGVAWIIFVCVTGQGGFVNRFLSSRIFIIISRLSYTIYLFHDIILEGYFLSLDDLILHSAETVIFYSFMVFWIIPACFIVSLIFEAPILRITALLFGGTNKETKSDKED